MISTSASEKRLRPATFRPTLHRLAILITVFLSMQSSLATSDGPRKFSSVCIVFRCTIIVSYHTKCLRCGKWNRGKCQWLIKATDANLTDSREISPLALEQSDAPQFQKPRKPRETCVHRSGGQSDLICPKNRSNRKKRKSTKPICMEENAT
jgi:hypothetical protein